MTLGFVNAFLATKLKHRYDCGDFVDQINYSWTPMLMMVFALTLFASQYVGQPIQCWVPAQFTGAWEKYAETYCFIKNTYYWPLHEQIPTDYPDRDAHEIGYYQWVPIVLCLQALMFWFPSMFWRIANRRAGLHLKEVALAAGRARKTPQDAAKSAAAELATMDLMQTQETSGSFGMYLTALYLFVKLLYLANVFLQFAILNQFLGTSYPFWGYGVLNDLANGREWNESGHFPRVTMCDFTVRVLGNLHRHTLQCVLMINMFNEKIYVFLWWWLLVVAIATVLNTCYWLLTTLIGAYRRSFVEQYLRVRHCISEDEVDGRGGDRRLERKINAFMNDVIKPDGALLLRIIQINGGDLVTGETVEKLWHTWHDAYSKKNDDDGFHEQDKQPLLMQSEM